MKFLRVNMTDETVLWQDVAPQYKTLGGRALTSIFINDEVLATTDPLGPDNKLIFAPGFFSGTSLINTSRLSVGSKSPLTGGIKESNVGGTVAFSLATLGICAIIIEGQADADSCFVLNIQDDTSANLIRADDLKGMRTYDLTRRLQHDFGTDTSITCIGPAGDSKLLSASIQSTDFDGRPCRAAGRGGLGAVMGAKGLKAIIVNRKGRIPAEIVDLDRFKKASKQYAKDVKTDEFSGEILPQLGTAVLVEPINAAGAFPTRNATLGQFEGVEKISGEAIAKIIEERGGQTRHKGCSQCIIDCSNEFVTSKGEYVTSSLEYETIWSMGGMIGNDDIDAIARLDFLCDDIGLDTINTGTAIAVAFDAGYGEFGDGEKAIRLVEEVATGTEMGTLIGNGPDAVGRHFSHSRVPTVKGQSIAAYDPRAIQGMSVTYSTTPMGADHTAGWVVDQNLEAFGGTVDPHGSEGQVEISRNTQIHMAAIDTVGLCDFAQTGLAAEGGFDNLMNMMSAKLGQEFSAQQWTELGTRVIKTELEFNRNAGLTRQDDRLPPMFYNEQLPPYNVVVKISDEELDSTFSDL
ncbi:aldehyde ferredoxin oxidoreductase family protein [Desulforhopalus singaporensis]|uniref:Aldehyde:ferredoxin oxidoreductase n=1 Tax=Desulforhopalus singaporensis TaxID=91360 RepID=A0A1H0TDJ9_9BACT|nr:aldehyde ferredoxin oxidoreductase C-terminal domain-containing protein [Desulforhopalus singaporensis]SDP51750.1 aldehyde:ferredoxin oxidoreductase [Desulforhopalus singaporensis]